MDSSADETSQKEVSLVLPIYGGKKMSILSVSGRSLLLYFPWLVKKMFSPLENVSTLFTTCHVTRPKIPPTWNKRFAGQAPAWIPE